MTLNELREDAWADVEDDFQSLHSYYTDPDRNIWPSVQSYNQAVSKIRAKSENTLNESDA